MKFRERSSVAPDSSPLSSMQRPTILVGHGDFGQMVLRRFLTTTALRGMLEWEEMAEDIRVGERNLKDLALIHIFDREPSVGIKNSMLEGSSTEVMRDLYSQIKEVPVELDGQNKLNELLESIAKHLLSAVSQTRRERDGALPLGLDVIIISHAESPTTIGQINNIYFSAFGTLANHANLQTGMRSADLLNFVHIIDTKQYWDRSSHGEEMRRAVHGAVNLSERRRNEGKPAFGRIYFVDGEISNGFRTDHERIDEISLFLEFLLFEGERGGPLQSLYQQTGAWETPVSTFGIRLMEHSRNSLSRLAAAHFGIPWLNYLIQHNSPAEELSKQTGLKITLSKFRKESLYEMIGANEIRDALQQKIKQVAQQLTKMPPGPKWPEQIQNQCLENIEMLEGWLTKKIWENIRLLRENTLAGLEKKITDQIDLDLHDNKRILSLEAVIRNVEDALLELEEPKENLSSTLEPSKKNPILSKAMELQSRFDRFQENLLDTDQAKQLWLLGAFMLSAVLTPAIMLFLENLAALKPQVGLTQSLFIDLLVRAQPVLKWLQNSTIIVSILVFLVAFWIGQNWFQRQILYRITRARAFWLDAERGRFANFIRSLTGKESVLQRRLEIHLSRQLNEIVISERSEVRQKLRNLIALLNERQREIRWLHLQLKGFQRIHGNAFSGTDSSTTTLEHSSIRFKVENQQDLQEMLDNNPTNIDRFRQAQSELMPFEGWSRQYNSTFLNPLVFLDHLSTLFSTPIRMEPQAELEQVGNDLLLQAVYTFLNQHEGFDLACNFKAAEGVTTSQSYCLLPRSWYRLSALQSRLFSMGITQEHIRHGKHPSSSRMFLLRIQNGISIDRLLTR